jgi:glycosyltransferase involved in cell wall biosynthesis
MIKNSSSTSVAKNPAIEGLVVIIPTYCPGLPLINAIDQFANDGIRVIVVDDGSGQEYRSIFNTINKKSYVSVLTHAVNLGKGQALKTAFNHVLVEVPQVKAVVTMDDDGQHLYGDVIRMLERISLGETELCLGVRKFERGTPFRSKLGNICTRFMFFFLTGKKLLETQTGLRGIGASLLPHLVNLKSNKYDFEMEMLFLAHRENISISQLPIKTVYIEGNKASHFNPLFDSLKIYYVFIRYISLSLVAALTDMIFFSIVYYFSASPFFSLVIGRMITIGLYFLASKYLVFLSFKKELGEIVRFVIMASSYLIVSYFLMLALMDYFSFMPYLAKIVSESCLFFAGFAAQRIYVFKLSGESN